MSPSPDAKAGLRFLRRASLDILQRTPSPAELRTYLGAPVGMVVDRLYGLREAMEVWLEEELFYFLLLDNFRPETRAIKTLPERLEAKKSDVRSATLEIILSTSFSLRNPGNDTFVSVVLEQCLGMTVQDKNNARVLEAGKKMYDGHKTRFLREVGSTQADLIDIVMRQRGFTQHLLDRHHERLFGRPLPQRDPAAEAVVDRVHQDFGQFFAVLSEWIASEDYRAALAKKKPRSDRQFIRGLYMDLLERRPTYEEMRNMRNAMQSMADPTPIRAVMAKVMLDSGRAKLPELKADEANDFVRRCFLRYLGREPGQEELPAFAQTLAQPGATATHVVRALVGSAEYQYY